jgi:hypothetical protein
MPCSPLKANERSEGICLLHLQCWRISMKYIASRAVACYLLSPWYLAQLIRPWRWRRYIPPKHCLTFNGLHGVISQKMVPLWGPHALRSMCTSSSARKPVFCAIICDLVFNFAVLLKVNFRARVSIHVQTVNLVIRNIVWKRCKVRMRDIILFPRQPCM